MICQQLYKLLTGNVVQHEDLYTMSDRYGLYNSGCVTVTNILHLAAFVLSHVYTHMY